MITECSIRSEGSLGFRVRLSTRGRDHIFWASNLSELGRPSARRRRLSGSDYRQSRNLWANKWVRSGLSRRGPTNSVIVLPLRFCQLAVKVVKRDLLGGSAPQAASRCCRCQAVSSLLLEMLDQADANSKRD